MPSHRRIGALTAAFGLAFIAVATLTPVSGDWSTRDPWCVVCGPNGGVDVTLNTILFVPFGFGLRLAGVAWPRALLAAVATTVCVEALQMHVVSGRDASLGDLLMNALGGAAGIALAARRRAWLLPPPAPARRLALLGGAAWLALVALGAWGVQPSLPRTTYWAQWAPRLERFATFDGELLSASLGELPLPPHRIAHSAAVRALLLAERVPLRARVVPGAAPDGRAPIVRLVDTDSVQLQLLAQRGRALEFSMRLRSRDLRLQSPTVTLARALPARPRPADTVRLAGGLVGRRLVVSAEAGGRRAEQVLPLGVGLAWTFFLPGDIGVGPLARVLTALWLGGLLVPAAYWSARATGGGDRWGRPGRGGAAGGRAAGVALSLVLLVAVALGLGAMPAAFELSPAHWSEWLAALTGVGIGRGLAAIGGRRRGAPPET